ncbi:hypothetical protein ONZ45_g13190 [Pleurotus djamor]|nr:hypothetical protein ONZ45_g13190 [Pleurotus djamor]
MAVVQTNINSCYGGTLNNVTGKQVNNINYHFSRSGGRTLRNLVSNRKNHSSSSATIDEICALLESFAPYSSLTFVPVLEEVESIGVLILCVTQFISLLDRVPLLRDFEFFKQTQAVLDKCNTNFKNLHEDLLAYEANIQSRLAGCGFFRAQFLLIHAHARWSPKLAGIQLLIDKNRQALEQCYRFFASNPKTEFWIELGHTDLDSARQRLLENEAFLSPGTRIRYLPPAQVYLKDHLDRTLCIPLELCASWKEFDTLVQRWCRDTPGANSIRSNSWELYNDQTRGLPEMQFG